MHNHRHPGHGAADWLSLAAAPTFAFMALMYLLMSAFHLGRWLRLISSRRTQRRNWAYWA
jgi:hypothetical protein